MRTIVGELIAGALIVGALTAGALIARGQRPRRGVSRLAPATGIARDVDRGGDGGVSRTRAASVNSAYFDRRSFDRLVPICVNTLSS
jgi:hypothetical protein